MPGKTVLVVDDDTGFRENLAGILNQFGYHALEAANGREALDAIERLPNGIDLMIVDLALPEVSGPEIIGAVARRKTAIKIIATSGVFDGAYLEMMKTVGADETILKTVVRPEKWLETINRLLGEEGEAAGRPSQRVVLLVDDEASVRSYVRRVLQRGGYQVLEAADGVDALDLVRKLGGAVDLLVTDVRMPRSTGTELAKVVKTEFPNLPVVFISGEHLKDQLHDPERRAVFVQKPFLPEVFLEAVKGLLPAIPIRSETEAVPRKKTG